MKNSVVIILFSLLFSCSENDNPQTNDIDIIEAENTSVLVHPNEIDANYESSDKSHYIVRNNQVHVNKLLLFIGGSFSTPSNYNIICDHAASIGLDVISLSYINTVTASPLGSSPDEFVFNNYRDEICFGNQVSDEVDVNQLNAITTRTIKLLQYLSVEYSDQNWSQYLTTSNALQWNKIIVSGHSQGSGHACYLGKNNLVDKVVMFSGPNDYHSFFNAPANWLSQNGATPLNKHFSLLHTQDQVVSFNEQVANLRGLGLLSSTENPVLADDLTAPFSNANALSLNITALSNHNAPIGSNAILPAIWEYMFLGE